MATEHQEARTGDKVVLALGAPTRHLGNSCNGRLPPCVWGAHFFDCFFMFYYSLPWFLQLKSLICCIFAAKISHSHCSSFFRLVSGFFFYGFYRVVSIVFIGLSMICMVFFSCSMVFFNFSIVFFNYFHGFLRLSHGFLQFSIVFSIFHGFLQFAYGFLQFFHGSLHCFHSFLQFSMVFFNFSMVFFNCSMVFLDCSMVFFHFSIVFYFLCFSSICAWGSFSFHLFSFLVPELFIDFHLFLEIHDVPTTNCRCKEVYMHD